MARPPEATLDPGARDQRNLSASELVKYMLEVTEFVSAFPPVSESSGSVPFSLHHDPDLPLIDIVFPPKRPETHFARRVCPWAAVTTHTLMVRMLVCALILLYKEKSSYSPDLS
ncbi:hypothetical protein EVAR_89818_1 [Eumeta japonica]|uniref:Uncharacterized protein n=1 Tax=Eumeta variegata TaxID=151549 RepID=A0A4C1YG31_EUMVA|nr:hypothetical protein EVAR_89818_1 [Eumeta japonica]